MKNEFVFASLSILFFCASPTFASGLSCLDLFHTNSPILSEVQPFKKYALPELGPNPPKQAIEGRKKLQLILDSKWPDSFLRTDFLFFFIHFSAYLHSEGNIKKQPELLLTLLQELKKFSPLVDLELSDLVAHLVAANRPIYQRYASDGVLENTLLTIMKTQGLYPKYEPKLLNSGPRKATDSEVDDIFYEGGITVREARYEAESYALGAFDRLLNSGDIVRIGGADPNLILPLTIKLRQEPNVVNPDAKGEAQYLLRSERYFLDFVNGSNLTLQSLEVPSGNDPRYPHISGSGKGSPQLNYFSLGKHQFLLSNSDGLFSVWQAPAQNFSNWKLIATVSFIPRNFKNLDSNMPKSVIGYNPVRGELVFIKSKNSFGVLIFGQHDNMSKAQGWYLYDLDIGPK